MIEWGTTLNKAILPVIIILLFASVSYGGFSNKKEIATIENPRNTSFGGFQNSPWPMACHDTRHTSLSPYNTANMPGIVKWRLMPDIEAGGVESGIAIGDNGILYFGSDDFCMNAAYPDGTIKWRFHGGGFFWATPAVGSDGTIYAGSWDCNLYAFYPNGTLKWYHDCGASITSASPVIGNDGTIYVGTVSPGNSIVAINPDGTEKWRYTNPAGDIRSAPVISLDGSLIFGSDDSYVRCLNSNGTLRWKYKTGDWVKQSASIAIDGTVYISSYDGYLYALNPTNGSLIWRCACLAGDTNPSIGPDGTIYVGSAGLYAVNLNGTIRWIFNPGPSRSILSSPAISADGIIYFGTNIGDAEGGEIIAVNPNGTERWRLLLANHGWVDSSPSIDSNGTVYIGSSSDMVGYLWAIGRGPLNVEANGPYTGYWSHVLSFYGDAFGGMTPYSYHWDFGDGTSSNLQNPTHNYTAVGNYTATFIVTDSEGNSSSDTAIVSIGYAPPSVSLIKPVKGFYLMNIRILPLHDTCIIIGPITVKVTADEVPLGMDRVEFYIDDKLVATDTKVPYDWTWVTPSFSKHTILVKAYDPMGHWASVGIKVTKLL